MRTEDSVPPSASIKAGGSEAVLYLLCPCVCTVCVPSACCLSARRGKSAELLWVTSTHNFPRVLPRNA